MISPDEIKAKEDELRRREEELRRREAEFLRRRAEVGAKVETRGYVAGDALYIGIDFGTSRMALIASNGVRKSIPTVVGWPKDDVAREFLRKDIVFGEEALRNRLALDLHYPLETGIFTEAGEGKGIDAARELLNYLLTPIKEPGLKTFCVIGVPAQASVQNKQALIDITQGLIDGVMVVPVSFMVAYGLHRLNNVMIVDLAAGTTNLCRVHGTLPTEEDQKIIPIGGNYIDEQLAKLITARYKGAQVTKEMAKRWKEQFGTVIAGKRTINVQFPVSGIPSVYDITAEMVEACRSIVPEIAVGIKELIMSYDPEFQDELRRNVILAGGGAQLPGLGRALEEELEDINVGPVAIAPDPLFCSAEGALRLARDTPKEYWEQLMTL